MRRPGFCVLSGMLVFGIVFGAAAPSMAIKQFRDAFVAKYVKADSNDTKERDFAAAVEAAKCNLCHQGTSKKDRNSYGVALDELLDRKTDKDDTAKVAAALDKAAEKKSDPKDANSPTFGQLISEGKLPCPPEKDQVP